jgi:transposase
MFRIGEWAESAAVTEYYGITAEALNDDRLGRALERVAEHGDRVQPALVLQAIGQYDLDVSQIHYDITNVELYGAYESEEESPAAPQPAYGRTKSGRKNVKQIQQGLNVTRDGGVPVCQTPLDGNAAEAPTHLENLKKLERTLPKQDLLYIADSKLDTPANLLAIAARKGKFICGGVLQPNLKTRYRSLRRKLVRLDYCSQGQTKLPPEERDEYRGVETEETLDGEVDGRPVRLKYRLLFIGSERKARDEAKTRERHVTKILHEFHEVERNLNKYSLKTEAALVRRLERAKGKYREGSLFTYQLAQRGGKFHLKHQIDQAALRRHKELEGVYVLKTNLSQRARPLARVWESYRGQTCVERRFRDLKGPLAVAPMFLKKPERMAGLLHVLTWALMIAALMERRVRRTLKGKPLYGLYPENRPSPAPTIQTMLASFRTLCIVIVRHQGEIFRRLAEFTPTQRVLINLLGIPPNNLRTFRRRCGM